MAHDFIKFPELTNRQMQMYYFQSPHQQITENFLATVLKVTDGDTIRVEVDFRDFSFPVRFLDLAAPEKNEEGGLEALEFLKSEIEGEEVEIRIRKNNRVGKWGRLLGEVFHRGLSMTDLMINSNHGIKWG